MFAGTTVVIAILGLFLAGLPAMTSMGIESGSNELSAEAQHESSCRCRRSLAP